MTEAVQRTIEHREIFHDEMLTLMRRIMSGEATPVLIAAILIGLRVKKETIGEIAAAAQVMREFATRVPVAGRPRRCVDIVGTGGDARAHVQHLDRRRCSSRRRPARAWPSTATARVSSQVRQRRRARGARREHRS